MWYTLCVVVDDIHAASVHYIGWNALFIVWNTLIVCCSVWFTLWLMHQVYIISYCTTCTALYMVQCVYTIYSMVDIIYTDILWLAHTYIHSKKKKIEATFANVSPNWSTNLVSCLFSKFPRIFFYYTRTQLLFSDLKVMWCKVSRVCCSVLQCVAVCCIVLQHAAACCSVLQCAVVCCSVLQRAAACFEVRCSALQCVTVCCSALQCVAVCYGVLQCASMCCSVLQCVTVCFNVLQCVTVCCSVLHWFAVCCSVM